MTTLDKQALEDAIRQSDWIADRCGHIAIHKFEDGTTQCKDCLRVWAAESRLAELRWVLSFFILYGAYCAAFIREPM